MELNAYHYFTFKKKTYSVDLSNLKPDSKDRVFLKPGEILEFYSVSYSIQEIVMIQTLLNNVLPYRIQNLDPETKDKVPWIVIRKDNPDGIPLQALVVDFESSINLEIMYSFLFEVLISAIRHYSGIFNENEIEQTLENILGGEKKKDAFFQSVLDRIHIAKCKSILDLFYLSERLLHQYQICMTRGKDFRFYQFVCVHSLNSLFHVSRTEDFQKSFDSLVQLTRTTGMSILATKYPHHNIQKPPQINSDKDILNTLVEFMPKRWIQNVAYRYLFAKGDSTNYWMIRTERNDVLRGSKVYHVSLQNNVPHIEG